MSLRTLCLLACFLPLSCPGAFFDSWTLMTLPAERPAYRKIAFGNGKFVAAGRNQIAVSTNGLTWREFGVPPSAYPNSIVFGDGRFVLTAEGHSGVSMPSKIFTSTDGENWQPTDIGAHELSAVAFGKGLYVAAGRRLVYVGPGWTSRCSFFRSRNGIDWEYQHVDLPGGINDLAYENGTFVAVGWLGHQSGVIYHSTDGADWQPATVERPPTLVSVAAGKGIFVAAGYPGDIFVSNDGRTWTEKPCGIAGPFELVAFENGTFFVGKMHSEDFAVSSDASIWTLHKFPPSVISDIAFGDGRFVGIGYIGWVVVSEDIRTARVGVQRTAGSVRIESAAQAGRSYQLVESETLYDWTVRTNFTQETTSVEFELPCAGFASFFRVQEAVPSISGK